MSMPRRFLRNEQGTTAQVLARHGLGCEDVRTEVLRLVCDGAPPKLLLWLRGPSNSCLRDRRLKAA